MRESGRGASRPDAGRSAEVKSAARVKPFIDVERYMEIRSAYGPSFSHDDRGVYFLSTLTGLPQVWYQEEGVPWPKQVTFFSQRVLGVSGNPAAEGLAVSMDRDGDERAQIHLLSADGVWVEDFSADPSHIDQFGGWSRDGARFVFATNRRDGVHFDVYVADRETREKRLVHQSDFTNYAAGFSPDGTKVLISRHHESLHNDLFLADIETGEMRLLTPHEGRAVFHSPSFARDGRVLYLSSNLDSEFERLARIDLETGEWDFITEDQWDVDALSVSHDGKSLAYVRNEDGTSALYVLDLPPQGQLSARRVRELPSGTVSGIAWQRNGQAFAVALGSPRFGVDIWRVDAGSGAVRRLTYASISAVPQETFVEPELVRYPSFDGLAIPAYLYRPRQPGPWPVVVDVHGGPEGQSVNGFSPMRQYFVNRGYAVLAPNVRGSSGYGRTYVHLDDVRKRMDSVADLAMAAEWLVKEGIARSGAVAVMGGSYGGFMVLAAVTHYPGLWAAGVDIVGIANLRTFIENTSPYRRHLRESEYGTIAEDGAFFDEISPIHHVDRIVAPMMIVHGARDPRVPVGEAEQITAALQARNHPVKYLRFEDEGHGIVKLQNRIRTYREIADFLDGQMRIG